MRRTPLLMAAAAALIAASGAALGQDKFEEWDADASGALSEEELTAGLGDTGAYDDLDTDNDDTVSQDEFMLGVFDWVDEDDDNQVAPEEFGVLNDAFPE